MKRRICLKLLLFFTFHIVFFCSFASVPFPCSYNRIIYLSESCDMVVFFADSTAKEPDFLISKLNSDGLWSNPERVFMNNYAVKSLIKLGYESIEFYACVNNGKKGKDICLITLVEGYCTAPVFLNNKINSKNDENNVCLSNNGNTLYFSSNRKGGYGGYDIYALEKTDDGTWSNPMNLGKKINSDLNEWAPFILGDNSTLFFSSDRKTGLGGFDIFSATLNDEGFWSEPENAGTIINSKNNEYGVFISHDESKTIVITDTGNSSNSKNSFTAIEYLFREFSLISK